MREGLILVELNANSTKRADLAAVVMEGQRAQSGLFPIQAVNNVTPYSLFIIKSRMKARDQSNKL